MPLIVYEPGTKTIIGLEDSYVIDLPAGLDLEEMEELCEKLTEPVEPAVRRQIEVDFIERKD